MQRLKKTWYNTPVQIRKPVVFVIGMLFVIASALTGWLPGPGGIPLFIMGCAILASEFEWAQRFNDRVIALIRKIGIWAKAHKLTAAAFFIFGFCMAAAIIYTLYNRYI